MRERRVGLVGRGPHPSEFEGLDMGEFSGGMDSCLRRNDGIGGFRGWGVVGERGALDSSRGIGMGRGDGGGDDEEASCDILRRA